MTRMSTALSQRGAVPAASPSATPATVATRTPSRLAISTGRAPKMVRLNMSRPSWSVPNQCAPPGGARTSSVVAVGPMWAISPGAASRMMMTAAVTASTTQVASDRGRGGLPVGVGQLPLLLP